MKKVSSSASYSQFRKKNPNIKQTNVKEHGLNQIDQLTKQLQAINSCKKINNSKYQHPNGIIEEEQEDDTATFVIQTKVKPNSLVTKKLKAITTKVQPLQAKVEPNKLNKSIEGSTLAKKEKQTVGSKQMQNLKGSTKLVKKEEDKNKLVRRMSLTNLYGPSLNSKLTNQSLNTTTSQSQNPISMAKKKQIIDKLGEIQSKLLKKSISAHYFQEIMDKMDKIEQILQDC